MTNFQLSGYISSGQVLKGLEDLLVRARAAMVKRGMDSDCKIEAFFSSNGVGLEHSPGSIQYEIKVSGEANPNHTVGQMAASDWMFRSVEISALTVEEAGERAEAFLRELLEDSEVMSDRWDVPDEISVSSLVYRRPPSDSVQELLPYRAIAFALVRQKSESEPADALLAAAAPAPA